jgi:hypothetical protein
MATPRKTRTTKSPEKLKDIKPVKDAKGGTIQKPVRPLGSGTGTGGTTGGGN